MQKKKDIILIIGGGGMNGVFTAGVLEVINKKYRDRIHSIYGTSSGADVGAYFISNQTDIPFCFFTKYLTKKEFLRKNIFSYLLKVFFFQKSKILKIKDFINIDFVIHVAKNSECKLDIENINNSKIPFFVKVINTKTTEAEYLPTDNYFFEKLKASSQMGPFSSEGVSIQGNNYIDGGTIPSKIDLKLICQNVDKQVIYITSSKRTLFSKIILYPFHLLAGLVIAKLYGKKIGYKYIKKLFSDYDSEIIKNKNVIHIKNIYEYPASNTDVVKLRQMYNFGKKITQEKLKAVR